MPSSAKYLQLNEIQAAIQKKTSQSAWTVAYFNTPAWAAGYNLKNSKQVENLKEIEELANTTQLLLVMPETEWEKLDKKDVSLKKMESQIFLITKYILAQSVTPEPPFIRPPNAEEPLNPAETPESPLPAGQNASIEAPALLENSGNSGQEEINNQNAEISGNSTIQGNAARASDQNATDSEAGENPQEQDAGITKPLLKPEEDATPQKPGAAEKEKTEDRARQEETVFTTYTPKAMHQIDLVYGKIPGMPELSVIVRYREIKQID